METKYRLILKHQDGLYLSWSINHFPLTPEVSKARRFYNAEEINHFLSDSYYRPDKPEQYEIIEIQIDYSIKESE